MPTPANYRFKEQTHIFLHNTAVDMTAATGDIVEFPVVFDRIQIIEVGWHYQSASGAVTTGGVMQVDKRLASGGARAILNSLAQLTAAASQAADTNVRVSLDTRASNTPVPGPPNYPQAVAGDVIVFERTTQGSGGTQSVKPWIIYREIDNQQTVASAGVGSGVS